MVKFADVTESTGSNELGIGEHLVKIVDSTNATKSGELMTDDNGIEVWGVKFENDNGYYREYFNFSGQKAHKTGNMFRAIGLIKEDEKLLECDKDFNTEDVLGKMLWITIEKSEKAKKGKWITFDGFKKYDGKSKSKPKKEEEEDEVPF